MVAFSNGNAIIKITKKAITLIGGEVMITLNDLHIRFGEKLILEDASMNLVAGKLTALIGKSGSGKTSLLNLLAEKLKKQRVLYISQQDNFFEKMNIQDNLILLGRLYGKNLSPNKIQKAMDNVGLKVSLKAYPANLSGGEKQRLLLAMALLIQADVILMDEISASMDKQGRERLIKLLKDFSTQTHCIMILATHDPLLAEACEIQYQIENQQLVCLKTASETESKQLKPRRKTLSFWYVYLKGCMQKQALLHGLSVLVEGIIVSCLVVGLLFFWQIDRETKKVVANTPSNQLLVHRDNEMTQGYSSYDLFFSEDEIQQIHSLENTFVYPFFNWKIAQYPSATGKRGDWYYDMTLIVNGQEVKRHVESAEDPSYDPATLFPYYEEQKFDNKAIMQFEVAGEKDAISCYLLEDYLPYLNLDLENLTSLTLEMEVNVPSMAYITDGYQQIDGQKLEQQFMDYTYETISLKLEVLGIIPHKSGNYQGFSEIYLPYETMKQVMEQYTNSNLLKNGSLYYANSYILFSDDVEKTTTSIYSLLPNASISHSQMSELSRFKEVQKSYVSTISNLLLGVGAGAILSFVLFSVLYERSFRKDRKLFKQRGLMSKKIRGLILKIGLVESIGIAMVAMIGTYLAYDVMYQASYMVALNSYYLCLGLCFVIVCSFIFGLVSHLYSLMKG